METENCRSARSAEECKRSPSIPSAMDCLELQVGRAEVQVELLIGRLSAATRCNANPYNPANAVAAPESACELTDRIASIVIRLERLSSAIASLSDRLEL